MREFKRMKYPNTMHSHIYIINILKKELIPFASINREKGVFMLTVIPNEDKVETIL